MRTRSLTGPLLLLIVGGLFLWRNLHPDTPVFELIAQYWPFLLIGWGVLRLAEVAFWSQARTRAFSGGEVVLVVMICIAGSLVWAARENGIHIDSRGLNWWGSSYDYPVEATAPAGSAKRIVFENPRGSIKVTGADTTEVAVTGHKSVRAYARDDADRTNGNTPVEIVPQGDHLLIRTNQDHAPENQQMSNDLEVTVPRGVSVEARGRNGDYEISDIAGDLELASDPFVTPRATLSVDAQWRLTQLEGPGPVFACGDAVRGQSLIVWAIAEGRSAAAAIDAVLMETPSVLPAPVAPYSLSW